MSGWSPAELLQVRPRMAVRPEQGADADARPAVSGCDITGRTQEEVGTATGDFNQAMSPPPVEPKKAASPPAEPSKTSSSVPKTPRAERRSP